MKKIKKDIYEVKEEALRRPDIRTYSQETLEKTLQFTKDTIADCESGKLAARMGRPVPAGFLEGVRVTLKSLEDELERRRLS